MASSPALLDWLKTQLAAVLSRTAPVTVRSSDKLSSVFATLNENNILSAAVFDEKAQSYTWVVDIWNIVEATIKFSGANGGLTAAFEGLNNRAAPGTAFANLLVNDAIVEPARHRLVTLPLTASLFDVIMTFQREVVQRVGLIDQVGKLVAFCSESAVVAHVVHHHKSAISGRKFAELATWRLMPHPEYIPHITEEETALEAFKLMHKHHVRALPVKNKSGRIVANISARDIKAIGEDAASCHLLELSVSAYLRIAKERSLLASLKRHLFSSSDVLTYTDSDTLIEIAQKLVHHRVHQIYYVDSQLQLLGVLTLKDILCSFICGSVKNITMLRLRILAIQDRKQLTEKEKLDLEAAKEQLAVLTGST